MMASLFSGVSGLKNHQQKLNVIGNNIANINTIGFKRSRVNFREALVQTQRGAGRPSGVSGGTNPIQLGLGMQVASVDTLWQQGGLETTGQITDLAIQGNGFFILGDFSDTRYYTRAGAFGFDANSNLVDPGTGLMVLGKMADRAGNISSMATLGTISLPFGQQDPPQPTSVVKLANNLHSGATDSAASIYSAGNSNVIAVQGDANDGVGGTHTISIEGEQAKQASFLSVTGGITNATLLTTLGVTDFIDFALTVDSASPETVPGLNSSSTVADLINGIGLIDGLSASLQGGEIQIIRDKRGASGDYNFTSSAGVVGNITTEIFGATFDSETQADVTRRGSAATFVATDIFLPTRGTGAATGPVTTILGLEIEDATGLVTGLSRIGGGGISLTCGSGELGYTYASPIPPLGVDNPLIIETEATEHTASIGIYDSQGEKHTLSVTFFKSIVANRWEWRVITSGNESVTTGQTGFVTFNSDGSLNTFDYNGGASSITIDPGNGASAMNVQIDAGSSGGYDGLTGYSASHSASIIDQNGYGLGILENVGIDKAGYISGIFSNGITRVLAQIILADFTNTGGLRRMGKSLYQPSGNSGEAREGVAGETIGAELYSGALESSSVDVAQEFTGMITAQRGFQANARIITTSDAMLDELVNIKR
jgi:flagellar hook protein FlgE